MLLSGAAAVAVLLGAAATVVLRLTGAVAGCAGGSCSCLDTGVRGGMARTAVGEEAGKPV